LPRRVRNICDGGLTDDREAQGGPTRSWSRTMSQANEQFKSFPFATRTVPDAPADFDYGQWKKNPENPLVLRGAINDWPLVRELRDRRTDEARLEYLRQTFGSNSIAYTKVPASDPIMGFDDEGRQNFHYAPSECTFGEFCEMLRRSLGNRDADILYARGGANSVRTWKNFSESVRPVQIFQGMRPNGEGVWLGSGRQVSYLHQDAHFNAFAMVTGVKRVLLYPLEAIADLYPTPFYGGIAGTTSSYVRPLTPNLQRFPRFLDAAKHAWTAVLGEGDLLVLPPCWWHYVEAAPGINLMINAFMWALPPKREYEFEVMMRKAIRMSFELPKEELAAVRSALEGGPGRTATGTARRLLAALRTFVSAPVPSYWQKIAWTYYDHYVFQVNGHPVPSYPERHTKWVEAESALLQRARQWYRFRRGLIRMARQQRRAHGIVP
jgi:hypothetical protein